MLIRQTRPKPDGMQRVLGAHDPAVVALGHTVAEGVGAWPSIQPLIRSSRVSSDLVDAIVAAERPDLAPLLLECLATAEPEQQRRALVLLNGSVAPSSPATTDVARGLATRRDPAVRGEAIVLLSRTCSRAAAVRRLIAALDDRDGRVRRRAAEALCPTVSGRPPCCATGSGRSRRPASIPSGFSRASAHPGRAACSPTMSQALQQDAERSAQLLGWIAAAPDRASWSAVELCLRDHQASMLDVILAALSPVLESRLARRLRVALRGSDQRSRASAFELIAAVPASQRPPGAVDCCGTCCWATAPRPERRRCE